MYWVTYRLCSPLFGSFWSKIKLCFVLFYRKFPFTHHCSGYGIRIQISPFSATFIQNVNFYCFNLLLFHIMSFCIGAVWGQIPQLTRLISQSGGNIYVLHLNPLVLRKVRVEGKGKEYKNLQNPKHICLILFLIGFYSVKPHCSFFSLPN